jgi:predicted  nucleic acid-binding Zn-ribbon protein
MRGSVAAVLGGLALLAAGCGGGGEEPLSKAEFQSQANAICAKYEKQLNALGAPSSIDEIPDLVQQALVILNKEIDEIAALNPPDEQQSDFDKLIAASNKTKAAANDLSAAAKSGDQAAVQKALEDGNAASDEADQLATGLGLGECNTNG